MDDDTVTVINRLLGLRGYSCGGAGVSEGIKVLSQNAVIDSPPDCSTLSVGLPKACSNTNFTSDGSPLSSSFFIPSSSDPYLPVMAALQTSVVFSVTALGFAPAPGLAPPLIEINLKDQKKEPSGIRAF